MLQPPASYSEMFQDSTRPSGSSEFSEEGGGGLEMGRQHYHHHAQALASPMSVPIGDSNLLQGEDSDQVGLCICLPPSLRRPSHVHPLSHARAHIIILPFSLLPVLILPILGVLILDL